MTVRELLNNILDTKFELEVYKEICIFLQEFISTDSRKASKAIEIDGQFVPDYVVEKILTTVNEKMDKLEEEKQKWETMTV